MTSPEHPAETSRHRHLVAAAVLGALGAGSALAFVALVAVGQDVLWPDQVDPEAWSGSLRMVVIMTAAGLTVGVLHRLIPLAEEKNVFVALAVGQLDRKAVPGAVAIASVSLIGGFSLGPEVPTGMAAAGVAGWIAHRRKMAADIADTSTRAAITGAWSGLFTAPAVALLLNVELNFERRILRWQRLTTDATAAIVGFAVFFGVTASWSDVLRILDLPRYDLELWHLAVSIGLGFLGAVLGTLFKLSVLATRRLAEPLAGYPILRCTLAGSVLGLVAMALPLTLFLGTDGLAQVTENPEALGVGLIVLSALVKLLATSGALSFGFVGGPVFPLLFAGGSLGAAINVAAPDVPQTLAITALMAAVPAAVLPVPLSLATLTILIAGVGPTEATPVFMAALVSLIVGQAIENGMTARRGPAAVDR